MRDTVREHVEKRAAGRQLEPGYRMKRIKKFFWGIIARRHYRTEMACVGMIHSGFHIIPEMHRATGFSAKRLRSALQRLEDRGAIKRTGSAHPNSKVTYYY